MRLLLVRHGVAEGQAGRVVGHTDPPLSAQGRADIAALLTSDPEPPALLLSSDLRRARESAEILAVHWGVEVVTDVRLRELHFGEWENRRWADLEREDGGRPARWMRDWTTMPTPGGESFTDLVGRTTDWLAEWQESRVTRGTTLLVAHAGSIRAVLCHLLRVPLDRAFGFEVHHARVTALHHSLKGEFTLMDVFTTEALRTQRDRESRRSRHRGSHHYQPSS